MLLNGRNLLGRNFHAEIATRHHNGIGGLENTVEMVDSLRLFELGYHPGVIAKRRDPGLDVTHVVGGLHEGDGNDVCPRLEREFEIDFVLLGQCGDLDHNTGEVDPLLLAQQATVDDLGDNVGALQLQHAQFDEAVGEQHLVARLQIFCKRGEYSAYTFGSTVDLLWRNRQALPRFEHHRLVVDQRSGTNLGPLQVGEDADGLILFAGDFAHHCDQFALLLVRSVRKVEARDVQSSVYELAKRLLRAGGRSQCRHDLRTPQIFTPTCA